jgi:hypothetical protein
MQLQCWSVSWVVAMAAHFWGTCLPFVGSCPNKKVLTNQWSWDEPAKFAAAVVAIATPSCFVVDVGMSVQEAPFT